MTKKEITIKIILLFWNQSGKYNIVRPKTMPSLALALLPLICRAQAEESQRITWHLLPRAWSPRCLDTHPLHFHMAPLLWAVQGWIHKTIWLLGEKERPLLQVLPSTPERPLGHTNTQYIVILFSVVPLEYPAYISLCSYLVFSIFVSLDYSSLISLWKVKL